MSSLARWINAGDGIHISAGLLLIGWILRTQTCRGISGRTQTVISIANFAKFAYSVGSRTQDKSSYEIGVTSAMSAESVVLMYLIFIKLKKTLEKAYDTFWIEVIIIISGVLAIVNNEDATDPFDVIYAGSYYLESVSILPQMYFNFRTGSKNLGVSSFVLVCTVYKSFHVYYAVVTQRYYAPVSLYPGYIQLGTYALYFILLIIIPKYKEEKLLWDLDSDSASLDDLTLESDNPPPVIIVTRPALDRQQSRLEMPFLKKTLTSASSLTAFASNGSHSSSMINSPAVRKKLKNVSSNPNFRAEKTQAPLKRTHSASSIVSLGRKSLVDSLDEGITFQIKETAREGRQRRMAYARQTSLPEKKTLPDQADEELKRTTESPEENVVDECVTNVEDGGHQNPPNIFQIHDLDSTRKNSDPNPRRPSCPEVTKKKRRKRTISISPDFHRKSRRATMQADPTLHHQPNWKVLASTFIGITPPASRPSSPIQQSEMIWPDSFGARASPRFEGRKKRRATVQALNTHHSSWKTLASGLIGTSAAPQSPMSARVAPPTPETNRPSVERSNSDSKYLERSTQRRATVQLSHAMPSSKKRSSWLKLNDGLSAASPAIQRRMSSPFNYFRNQRKRSKEEKPKGGEQRSSRDQSEDIIEEDVESKEE